MVKVLFLFKTFCPAIVPRFYFLYGIDLASIEGQFPKKFHFIGIPRRFIPLLSHCCDCNRFYLWNKHSRARFDPCLALFIFL